MNLVFILFVTKLSYRFFEDKKISS